MASNCVSLVPKHTERTKEGGNSRKCGCGRLAVVVVTGAGLSLAFLVHFLRPFPLFWLLSVKRGEGKFYNFAARFSSIYAFFISSSNSLRFSLSATSNNCIYLFTAAKPP